MLFAVLLVLWHRSFDAEDALGRRSHRRSQSLGGRWEYRFAGVSIHRGVIGIGILQETSSSASVADHVFTLEGWSLRGSPSFWQHDTYGAFGAFGVHRINVAAPGSGVGYVGRVVTVPIWAPLLLAIAWPVVGFYRRIWLQARQFRRAQQRLCPMCGYDLRGGVAERCPECGTKRDETWPTTA